LALLSNDKKAESIIIQVIVFILMKFVVIYYFFIEIFKMERKANYCHTIEFKWQPLGTHYFVHFLQKGYVLRPTRIWR